MLDNSPPASCNIVTIQGNADTCVSDLLNAIEEMSARKETLQGKAVKLLKVRIVVLLLSCCIDAFVQCGELFARDPDLYDRVKAWILSTSRNRRKYMQPFDKICDHFSEGLVENSKPVIDVIVVTDTCMRFVLTIALHFN